MFNDDILFSILNACSNTNGHCKLISSIYLYKIAGLDINVKFKLPYKGIESQELSDIITNVISKGYLEEKDSDLCLTNLGYTILESFVGSLSELEYIESIQDLCSKLTYEELNFICITDFIIQEVLTKYGVDGLITQEERIKSTLKLLSPEYSEENFNIALGIANKLRRGIKDE